MINQCHLFLNQKILLQEQKSLIPVAEAHVHTADTMSMTKFELYFTPQIN